MILYFLFAWNDLSAPSEISYTEFLVLCRLHMSY